MNSPNAPVIVARARKIGMGRFTVSGGGKLKKIKGHKKMLSTIFDSYKNNLDLPYKTELKKTMIYDPKWKIIGGQSAPMSASKSNTNVLSAASETKSQLPSNLRGVS